MQRTNRSEEVKAALIARFEQSGLRAREFCREQGLAYQSFMAWRRKGREGFRSRQSPAFRQAGPARKIFCEVRKVAGTSSQSATILPKRPTRARSLPPINRPET